MQARRRPVRAALLSAGALLAASAMLLSGLTAASAAEVPSGPVALQQRTPDVLTADPLPTVQIDAGVVWSQAIVGSTVYAAGDFDNARAPFANPGTNLTPRANMLAYDIDTGALLPFAPQIVGVVKSVVASADGSRLFIGGSFSSVNGEGRFNFAAIDAATGALVPGFSASIGGAGVFAMARLGDTIYVTGRFTQANGVARANLAAFATSNGALRPWAPTLDLQGDAMVIDPGGQHVIAGGRFYQVNGVVQRGMAALDPVSGALDTTWAAPNTIKNGWNSGSNAGKAGIFQLAVDDSGVYGTGWVFADVNTGNLEGVFALEAGTGEVRWIADCHGDHFAVYSTGDVVYSSSHMHECDTVGLAPEQSPRTYRYMAAFSATAEGRLTRSPSVSSIYKDWSGTPAPEPYAWYPDFTIGQGSGLGETVFSMVGKGDVIAMAGEFTSVNNLRYQGIVRFSTNPQGGPKQGPRIASAAWGAPSASSVVAGRARIAIPGNWDRDDRDLTYQLQRAGAGVVQSRVVPSSWWSTPAVLFDDTGLVPGATYTYSVRAVDGNGNAVTSQSASVTVATGESSPYAEAVLDDGAALYYPLGTIRSDWAGASAPTFGSGVTTRTPGAVSGVTGQSASTFSGAGGGDGRVTSGASGPPSAFSTELWFNTTTTRGGKLIGFGNAATGSSSSYDRHIYMTNAGRLVFGVYPGGVRTVTSNQAYNDGRWHHAVATQGPGGIALYVDGELVGADASVTTAQSYTGRWRIGGDNLNGWPSAPTSLYFAGAIDEVAVYQSALSAGQVMQHYAVGLGQEPPTAAFESTVDDLSASFDASGSTADDGATIASYAWGFGDGSSGTGVRPTHVYAQAGTYAVTLTVTDSRGVSAAATRSVTVLAANAGPIASFTSSMDGMSVQVNGLASSDPDGSIASYSWDWGDGSPDGTGATASHTYATVGARTISLTVTDDRGGQATTSAPVTATHGDPTASFTATVSGLGVAVDASGSTAEDGATLSYAWSWGDGETGSGATATHEYEAAGDYAVRLTVTDSLGATATTTRGVSVSAAAFIARDDFARTVSSGWGAADTGGMWTPMHGSAAPASVNGSAGVLQLVPNQTRNMALQGISVADTSTTVRFSVDQAPATGNSYVGVATRQSASANYTVRAWMRSNGTAWLVAERPGATLATQALGLGWTAGDELQLRVQVTGSSPTTIQAKLWRAGTAEPTGWQLSTTDATPGLQGAGWVSLHANRPGSATSAAAIAFDELRVLDPAGGAPQNAAPVAAFTSTASDLRVGVDASGSSDADGSIAAYSWSWGDGTPAGSGRSASHDYASPGTYTVTLTVTDDRGATASTSAPVTVSAPPAGNAAPTASFTSTATGLGVSVDASASSDDGSIASYTWDWGDGGPTSSGVTATRAYASAGTYTVTLTVTDDEGATGAVSRDVTVAAPGAFAASDDFGRAVTSGWGSADVGGPWRTLAGTATPLSVSGGTGVLTMAPGGTRNVVLGDVSLRDVRIAAELSLAEGPATGASYFGVIARSTSAGEYIARVWLRDNGSVWLVLQRGSTVLRASAVPGLTWSGGDAFALAVEVTGGASATVSARIWRAGTPEPSTWQATATDASALAAGSVGVHANRSSLASAPGTFRVDAFRVTELG